MQFQTLYCTAETVAGACLALALLAQYWGPQGFLLALDNKHAALQGVAAVSAGAGVGLAVGLSAVLGTSATLPAGSIGAKGGLLQHSTRHVAGALAGGRFDPDSMSAAHGAAVVLLSAARAVGLALAGLVLAIGLISPVSSVAEHGLGAFVDLDAASVLATAEWDLPLAGPVHSTAGYMLGDAHAGTFGQQAGQGSGGGGLSAAAAMLQQGTAGQVLEMDERVQEQATVTKKVASAVAGSLRWVAAQGLWVAELACWPIVAAAQVVYWAVTGAPGGLVFASCSTWLLLRQACAAAMIVAFAGQLAATMLEERLTRSARFEQVLDGVVGVGEQPRPNRTGLARTTMHPEEGARALDVAVSEAFETMQARKGTGKRSGAWRQWRCLLATGSDFDTFQKKHGLLAGGSSTASGGTRRGGRRGGGAGGNGATQISGAFRMDHGRANLKEMGATIERDEAAAASAGQTVLALMQRIASRPPVPLNPPTAWLARGLRLYRASCLGIGPDQLDRSSLLLLAMAQARPGSIAQFAAHYQPWQGLDESERAWDAQITQLSEAHVNATSIGRKKGTLALLLWQQRLRAVTASTYAREVGILGRPTPEPAFDPNTGRRLRHSDAADKALGRYSSGPLDWAWLEQGQAPPWLLLAREQALAHLDRLLPTSKPLHRELLGDVSGNRQRALMWMASGIVDAQAVAADAMAVSVQAPSMARYKSRQARLGGPRVCRSLPGAAGRLASSLTQRAVLESGPLDVVLEQARWLRRSGLSREQAQEEMLRQHRLARRSGVIADRFWASMAAVPMGWFVSSFALCGTAVRSCSPFYCCLFPLSALCRAAGPAWNDLFCHAGGTQPASVAMRRCARPAVRRLCCIKDDSVFSQTNLHEGAVRRPGGAQGMRKERRKRGRGGDAEGRGNSRRWVRGSEARQRRAVREMLGGGDGAAFESGSESDGSWDGSEGESKRGD